MTKEKKKSRAQGRGAFIFGSQPAVRKMFGEKINLNNSNRIPVQN